MTSVEKALLYDKYRLPYGVEMIDELLERISKAEVVADIGAGTGQLAKLFANRSAKVYAVEPDAAMRQVASTALAGLSTVEVRAGSAEQTTLADDSIDLIVVGNAFHRFKPEACDELRRILRPQGWIAVVMYSFTNNAFTEMLFSKLDALKAVSTRIDKAWHRPSIASLFENSQIHALNYHQSQLQDWDAFFGAACSGIEAPERTDQEFVQFEALNREVFDRFAVNGKIRMDYATRVSFGQPVD